MIDTGVPPIPAMTSQAERECYYRLAKEAAPRGEVIEFGAWRGASSAYIAAAMRDSTGDKAHIYDKFEPQKSHARKIREFYEGQGIDSTGIPVDDAKEHFRHNLGPLMDHVTVHHGQIERAKWDHEPISFILFDAPKRVPAVSAVLTNFRDGIGPGTVMAWQDFCHFPSYEIPACLYRIREHLEFREAVVPGSTLVFGVKSRWDAKQASRKALALDKWAPDEIAQAWRYWDDFVPDEKFNLFMCGQAMFLADIGYTKEAVAVLRGVMAADDSEVLKKWQYLRKARPDFFVRYRLLFDCIPA